jgi:8-oxo-dGTP pyrophosphatase MutT (NUDIX family)
MCALADVDVVVGIILDGDRFLVERRRLDEDVDQGVVCLPGGHVRVGEGLEEALRREMHEELGIEVKGVRFSSRVGIVDVCKNFYVASNGERQNAYCFLVRV